MQIIAAYLLAVLGGNDKPTFDDLQKIVESVNVTLDKAQVEAFIAKAGDKTVDELIEEGKKAAASPITAGGSAGSDSDSDSGSGSDSDSDSGSDSDSDSSSSSGPGAAAGFSLF